MSSTELAGRLDLSLQVIHQVEHGYLRWLAEKHDKGMAKALGLRLSEVREYRRFSAKVDPMDLPPKAQERLIAAVSKV